MGLPWVRLDTSMPDNPKLLDLMAEEGGKGAAFVWVCGLAYSGKHGTDGFIPQRALPFIWGTDEDAKLLVAEGFWEVVAGGWQTHGWADFQQSNEETQMRRERARKAAAARWSKDETRRAQ